MRFDYELPETQQFSFPNLGVLEVSADGKQFVYAAADGLYVRSLDEYLAKPISGTETNPRNPFFSPDGEWIGYWSGDDLQLRKIAISGGAPVVLCSSNIVVGASWGEDDKIVYGEVGKGIMRISANGGGPELLAELTGNYILNFARK